MPGKKKKWICCLCNCIHSWLFCQCLKPSHLLLLFSSLCLPILYVLFSLYLFFIFFHHPSVFEICFSIPLICLSFNSLSLSPPRLSPAVMTERLAEQQQQADKKHTVTHSHAPRGTWVCECVCVCTKEYDWSPRGPRLFRGSLRKSPWEHKPRLVFHCCRPSKNTVDLCACVCIYFLFSVFRPNCPSLF